MSSGKPLPRRSLLLGTAATTVGGALGLCACSVPSSGGTAVPLAPGASAPTGRSFRIGKLSEVSVGDTATGKANGRTVVVFRPEDRKVVAYDATCTHAGCPVAPAGTNFECPCHGSTFSGSDGSVITGPARRPLMPLTAAIDGDWITVVA
ncbi:Cytochrome b6-f complex iron-sulfur subunit [Arthrobacter sp. Bi83]|uniref:Rieske (2Fe-2S) protein n=1 Tax=Arthrobacter sp. Bi83 TaxID=2822353 RepID=UPI001DCD2ADA|nr:Rieske (2Fe-2S) protein [Arthrobacter sp. Bi83]CAH0201182.1 Cytochrome b6-f complex iron-sulfur subunit [Arthrobacter sp. Bi83]